MRSKYRGSVHVFSFFVQSVLFIHKIMSTSGSNFTSRYDSIRIFVRNNPYFSWYSESDLFT